jgi:UDP-glucose 4-epimerase
VISWVIGRGGLLGHSVELALTKRGATWHPNRAFTWHDSHTAEAELTMACRDFAREVGDSPWQIAWCAGAGVSSSAPSDLEQETVVFGHLLKQVTEAFGGRRGNRGAMFLASSAGGVYAGAHDPPFREDSSVAPLSAYGWNKLAQESLARSWSQETANPLFIGRLSNLYGPRQKLRKNQGLITQVCLQVLVRQPLILYVPLDTIRDYLFAEDAGRLIADGFARLRREASELTTTPAVTKVLASQQPATIATVLAQFRWILKRPVSVIMAVSPNARHQVRDLRLISTVWPELDQRPLTPLSAGIRSVLTGVLETAGGGQIGGIALSFSKR